MKAAQAFLQAVAGAKDDDGQRSLGGAARHHPQFAQQGDAVDVRQPQVAQDGVELLHLDTLAHSGAQPHPDHRAPFVLPHGEQGTPDALTIAETWFDSSKYFLGDTFDSTMNYIFRNAVLDYAAGADATSAYQNLELMREAYPPQAFYALMNLLSTHDQARSPIRRPSRRRGAVLAWPCSSK